MKLCVSLSDRDLSISRDPNTQLHINLSLLRLLMEQFNHGFGINAKVTLFTKLHWECHQLRAEEQANSVNWSHLLKW